MLAKERMVFVLCAANVLWAQIKCIGFFSFFFSLSFFLAEYKPKTGPALLLTGNPIRLYKIVEITLWHKAEKSMPRFNEEK